MPDLLRRAAALTMVSVLGVAVFAPLAARSATPEVVEAQRLLDAVAEPRTDIDRASLSGRQTSAARSLIVTDRPLGAEPFVGGDAPVAPPVAAMEATLHVIPTPKPKPAPRPVAAPAPSGTVDASVWDRLAHCESSGNWAINTGNGYYGGLQFDYPTWHAYGGGAYAEYPHQATREQQIATAERLHAARGFQPWPACRRKLGLP